METIQLLKEKGKFLNISAIEKELNITHGIIQRALNGSRVLSEANNIKLNQFLNNYFNVQIEQIKEVKQDIKPIIKPLPRVKQSDINNYQLLFSGNYKHKTTGEIITKEEFNAIKKAT